MPRWTLNEIAEMVDGRIVNAEADAVLVTGVQFDSRRLEQGDLFVPIVADRDGHSFIGSAIGKGASAAFWSNDEKNIPEHFPAIIVEDTFIALKQFAKGYLNKINPKVVGITGSNGKTTTKDMTEAVISQGYKTHKTKGNYNNQIGVPITVLTMPEDTEALVLEMGMDRAGEIHTLSTLVEPDVTVITMIGESHIEFLGSREKIADAKVEIVDGLKDTGILIYNGDESLLNERVDKDQRTKTFGKNDQLDLYATEIDSRMRSTSFTVNIQPNFEITIPTPGKYNVQNALAAILVGAEFNISLERAAYGLQSFQLTKNRLEWLDGLNGTHILNDAYNASPSSMKAVLDYFSTIEIEGNKIAVLGDIRELGHLSKELHQTIAESISKQEIDTVVLYGTEMKYLFDVLKQSFDNNSLKHFKGEKTELIKYLKDISRKDDAILLKSSFGTDLLGVVEELRI